MKNSIKFPIVLSLCALMAMSCNEEPAPLASSVEVDKSSLTFESENAAPQTVNVSAEGDWLAVIPDWLDVQPNYGTGDAVVTVSADDNYDTDGTLAGPRKATISFLGNDVLAEVAVAQEGDPEKDPTRTYRQAGTVTSGKAYLIVSGTSAAKPVSGNYGYLYVDAVEVAGDEIVMESADNGFTFTSVDGGYTIQDVSGKYYYQSGSYDNFNVSSSMPESGAVWTLELQPDGTMKITNVTTGKFIQFSTGYGSFGAYSDERGKLPVLYEEQSK